MTAERASASVRSPGPERPTTPCCETFRTPSTRSTGTATPSSPSPDGCCSGERRTRPRGTAWPLGGIQFHAELGPEGFRDWVEGSGEDLRRLGRDPDALLAAGLPRLTAALPVLDRLLAALALDARGALAP